MSVKRVAITTGGGDCPGLNAVIRAVVRVGKEKYGWDILGIEDAMNGLVDLDYRSPHGNMWLDEATVRGILARGGTILGTSNRSDPFRYVVKDPSGRERETDVSDVVMKNFEQLGLDAMISIGGDGSMRISARFLEKGMNIVGVPKTIDNDLPGTDQTFGFDTAVDVATDALDRLRDTADSHDRVILVEVMGRDAGWIALHAGLAGGADCILIPEIPYDIEPIAKQIRRRRAAGKNYSLICVAEGAKPKGGDASVGESRAGAMPRLMGAAQRVAEALSEQLEADLRVTVLGHIQRGGSPSSYDRVLATRYGVAAAELVAKEEFGKMVSLRNGDIVAVDMPSADTPPRLVSPDDQTVQQARDMGVCFGEGR
ncbi:MAG TPA: ATP-dependent 6-phosphofructokinase [Sandaracinaceae bacterium LLY-WYZ-13_1]|nr:ATP-dependent 6-phosphofructokinase [Sandaracinaceae bacterium LLY-WYZ-13_1]